MLVEVVEVLLVDNNLLDMLVHTVRHILLGKLVEVVEVLLVRQDNSNLDMLERRLCNIVVDIGLVVAEQYQVDLEDLLLPEVQLVLGVQVVRLAQLVLHLLLYRVVLGDQEVVLVELADSKLANT